MKPDDELESALKNLRFETGAKLDKRVFTDAAPAMGIPPFVDESAATSETFRQSQVQWKKSQPRPRNGAFRRRISVGAVAALLLACLSVASWIQWTSKETLHWAHVAKAAAAKQWIRASASLSNGELLEYWASPKYEIKASRTGQEVAVCDFRRGVQCRYFPQSGTLHRSQSTLAATTPSLPVLEATMQAFATGDHRLETTFAGSVLVSQQTHTDSASDAPLTELTLVLRQQKSEREGSIVFLIDSTTGLPDAMQVNPWWPSRGDRPVVFFDYPKDGPLDAYGLGAPRSARVVDIAGGI